MPVLRRQTRPVSGDGHVCRDPLPAPVDPAAPVLRVVHRTGRIYPRAMGGDAVNQVIARRAAAAGWPPEKIALLGGHSLQTYRREHSPLVGNIVQQLDL